MRKAVGQGVAAEEQQFRVFTAGVPHERDPEAGGREPKVSPAIPYGGRAQGDNPALYVLRTGDNPVGKQEEEKHLPGEHDQLDHGPGGDEEPSDRRYGFTAGHTKISDAKPGTYRVWRTGNLDDPHGRGVFFAFGRSQAESYETFHDQPVGEYTVDLKRPLMAPNQHKLLRQWFGISGMGGAQERWPKLDGPALMRKVDVMIRRRAVKLGYDAIVYYDAMPPAKQELAVFKSPESFHQGSGQVAASMTSTDELFTADYEDPTDELDLHNTPASPHREHGPRAGREMPKGWSRGEGVAYHVYPEHEGSTIQEEGVVPGYHGSQYEERPRVFVFTDQDEAAWYSRVQEDDAASEGIYAPDGSPIRMRVMPVDITDLPTRTDDTLGPGEETTALQVAGGISADRLQGGSELDLHNTPRSPHRLHDPRVGQGREDAFKRMTHEQKLEAGQVHRIDDEMREALDRLTGGAAEAGAELSDPGDVLDTQAWTVLANNLDRHLDEHAAYIPKDADRRLRRVMQRQLQLFHEVGMDVDPRALDAYLRKAINAVAYQEVSTWQRQMGDHGVRHITEDMELADDMLGSLQEAIGNVSAEDRLLASVSLLFHDIGYTAGAARESIPATSYHHQYSAEYVRTSPEINAVFSPEQVEKMRSWVETHDGSKIDWAEDPVGSSIRLADNLSLFAREKLPALFRYVPGAVRELKAMGEDIVAGETRRISRRKAKLRQLVDGAKLSDPMKEGLLGAVDRVFSKSPKFTLGMLAGERMSPTFDGKTMHVPVRFSGYAKTLQSLFDLGQEQFVKLAESYGMTPQDAESGEFTFHNEEGDPVLHIKAVGATTGVFEKHLPGEHDQKKHGRDRTLVRTSVQTQSHAEAMTATRDYLKQYADFAEKTSKRPGWKYTSVEGLLMEEGTWYTDEEYTPEEEEYLLRLFKRLGPCKARECYMNAMRMAMAADDMGMALPGEKQPPSFNPSYAEGLAHAGLFPMNHAFFVLNGKPVDLTWGRTREEEDPMAGAARRGRQRSPQKLLQRAKENLEDNAYVGIEVPIKKMYALIMERGYYGSVFEVFGDSKFPLIVRDGVPEEWKQSGTLTKVGPALWTLRKHPASAEHDHDPRRRKGLEGQRTPLSQKLREAVLGDEPVCTWCGTAEGEFDVDHMVPVKLGGRNARVNLRPACQTCNRARGAKRSGRSQEWVRAAEDEALRAFMETALSRPRGRLAASMTSTDELFTADYEDPTDELDLHDTPKSKHKEHDPRYGRAKEEPVNLPSSPEEARGRREAFIERLDSDDMAAAAFFSTERLEAYKLRVIIDDMDGALLVLGRLRVEDVDIGKFARSFMPDGRVEQDSFYIHSEEQRKGYATEFKEATHRRYAEAGFHLVELSAVSLGRYAWAKMGYGFYSEIDLSRYQSSFKNFLRTKAEAEAPELGEDEQEDVKPYRDLMAQAEAVGDLQTPLDFADAPHGKEFMLHDAPVWADSWGGFKVINEGLWEEASVTTNFQRDQWRSLTERGSKVAAAVLQRSDCPALYVMKHDTPASPHKEHDPRTKAFHGVDPERAGSIKNYGLRRGLPANFGISETGRVYLTTKEYEAAYYGEMVAVHAGLDEYAVVEFELPEDIIEQLKTDPNATTGSITFTYEGDIDPEWVVGTKTYPVGADVAEHPSPERVTEVQELAAEGDYQLVDRPERVNRWALQSDDSRRSPLIFIRLDQVALFLRRFPARYATQPPGSEVAAADVTRYYAVITVEALEELGVVEKHDTPASPHSEHGPDAQGDTLDGAKASALWRRRGTELNQALRSGDLTEEQEQLAVGLDLAISQSSAAGGGTRFRGLQDGSFLQELEVGDTFTEPGFVSVTDNDSVAGNFADGGKNPTLVMVSVKKGNPALRVLKPAESSVKQEHELLLGRGQTFRIKKIWPYTEGDQVHTVVIEAVSSAAVEKHDTPRSPHKEHGPGGGQEEDLLPHEVREDPSKVMIYALRQAIAGTDLAVKVRRSKDVRTITLETPDGRGFAQIAVWRVNGAYAVQQHDMSLPEEERGKGLGGKMIEAMAAAYRTAGVSEVPIHVNTNPSFWDNVKEKHPGLWKHLPGGHDQKRHGRHGRSDWSGELVYYGKGMSKATKERRRKKLVERYGDDDEFKLFGTAVSLYTQGFFADIRRVGAAMATDTLEDLEANAVGFFGEGFQQDPDEKAAGLPPEEKDPVMAMVGGLYEVIDVTGEQIRGNIIYTFAQQLAHSIANAIEHAEPTDQPLYRGVTLSKNLELEVGDTFDIPGSASFTRSEELGKKFATGKVPGMGERSGYRYTIRVEGVNRAVDVDVFSPWNQQEAITNGRFEVVEFSPASKHGVGGKRRGFGSSTGAIGEIVLRQLAVVDADYTGKIKYDLPRDVGKDLTANEREHVVGTMRRLAEGSLFGDEDDYFVDLTETLKHRPDDEVGEELVDHISTAMRRMGYWVGEDKKWAEGHVLIRTNPPSEKEKAAA